MLSDVTSREISVRSTSSLNDSLIRASADLQSVASSSSYYFLESPQDDGIIYSGSVFGGIPYRFEILSKASSADFEAYVASGDTVEFVTYDANGVPYSQAAVSAGTAVNVPLPATSTGYVTVSSLGAKSEFEVGRHGSKFSHPYPSVQAYRLAGRAKEFL
ncbi:MAG: hypothetical protein QG650_1002 [Patescibacteria group bacterium]|nr:hypothetical protein [Patescibacteria group bacterium]